jgi:hypothetical protein
LQFDRRAISVQAGRLAAVPVAAVLAIGAAVWSSVAGVTMGAGAMLVADRTGPDRTEPAPAPALPDLRASYDALERTAPGDPDGVALLSELDEIVDAANGLAALAGLESIDRDEDAGQA